MTVASRWALERICCASCWPSARYSAASRRALGAHAVEHLLRNLPRQIDPADARVHDRNSETLGFAIDLVADFRGQRDALLAHDLGLGGVAQNAAQGGIEHRGELVVGARDAAHGLVEFQRVGDAIAHEGVHFEPLVVGGENLLLRQFEIEDALVHINDGFDQRPFEMQAGFGDEAASGAGSPKRSSRACSIWLIRRSEDSAEDQQDQGAMARSAVRLGLFMAWPPGGGFGLGSKGASGSSGGARRSGRG